MLTKTKIALAAALFAATSSVAVAQGFDANLTNRYQGYVAPNASAQTSAPRTLQSRDVGLTNGQFSAPSPVDVDRNDRASSPYSGGGF